MTDSKHPEEQAIEDEVLDVAAEIEEVKKGLQDNALEFLQQKVTEEIRLSEIDDGRYPVEIIEVVYTDASLGMLTQTNTVLAKVRCKDRKTYYVRAWNSELI